ncbi:MAG: hypothetical protein ABIR27_05645 [Dokdonella sp.]
MFTQLPPAPLTDGFEDLNPRIFEIQVRRRVGTIEPILLLMVLDSSAGPTILMFVYSGAECLRQVWLAMTDVHWVTDRSATFNAQVSPK